MVDFSSLFQSDDPEKKEPRESELPLERKDSQDFSPKKEAPSEKENQEDVSFSAAGDQTPQEASSAAGDVSFSDASIFEKGVDFDVRIFEHSKQIYLDCVSLAEQIINLASQDQPIDLPAVRKKISELVEHTILGNQYLVALMNEYRSGNYLAMDLTNVAILSVEIGIQLGYNKSKLDDLALSAFFHDIGLSKMLDLIDLPRIFSFDEIAKIKNHPLLARDLLIRFEGITQEIIDGCLQHHERLDGSGYPQGLKKGRISEFGQIIGVADMFESLTHPRKYRKQLTYLDAFKVIFKTKSHRIDPRYVDALIKSVGIYPFGSWVMLDNNFVGKVAHIDKNYPLRPVVLLLFDNKKRNLDTPRRVDLKADAGLQIKTMLSPEEISLYTSHAANPPA